MEQMQDICRGSVGPLLLDGANSRKCYASNLTLKWQRFCLIIVDTINNNDRYADHVAFFNDK